MIFPLKHNVLLVPSLEKKALIHVIEQTCKLVVSIVDVLCKKVFFLCRPSDLLKMFLFELVIGNLTQLPINILDLFLLSRCSCAFLDNEVPLVLQYTAKQSVYHVSI